MKNSKDTIGNRTRDLLACSVVPQPTTPLRAPCVMTEVTVIMNRERKFQQKSAVEGLYLCKVTFADKFIATSR